MSAEKNEAVPTKAGPKRSPEELWLLSSIARFFDHPMTEQEENLVLAQARGLGDLERDETSQTAPEICTRGSEAMLATP